MQILLAVFFALLFAQSAWALPSEVTVELFGAKPPSDRITIKGPVRLIEPRTQFIGHDTTIRASGRQLELQGNTRAHSLTFAPAGSSGITLVLGNSKRSYAGKINIVANASGKLVIHNQVPMRDYVKSVVGSETDPAFALEALKAQAICSQTLMARYKPGDTLSDTTEKQAYLGLEYVRPQVSKAVDAVFGKILKFNNLPAQIYFHSTCAGGTSEAEEYLGLKKDAAPYLRDTKCEFCAASPFYKEHFAVIPAKLVRAKLGTAPPVILLRDAKHRPTSVSLGSKRMSGFAFWTLVGQSFGWDKVPGTRFDVHEKPNHDLEFSSTGAGHGIGMCQWGAHGQGKQGKDYSVILTYYFPFTEIE